MLFFCLVSSLNYVILSQVGLHEVPVTYLGPLGYFPIWGHVWPDGHPYERLLLTGGPVCAVWLACSCTLSVYTPPLRCCQLITGGSDAAPP
jgi:hypothetical protein